MRLSVLAAAALAAIGMGGCCAPMHCGPCGPHDIVAAAPCEPCGPTDHAPAPHYEPPPHHEPPCGPPCVACGVNGPCPKHKSGYGLIGYLFHGGGCGGCGEFYLHPWINDPPAPCDPCDHLGNWIGHCPVPPLHHAGHHAPCGPSDCHAGACPVGVHNLWGYRADLAGWQGHGHGGAVQMGAYDGQIIEGPTLAPPPEMEEVEEGAEETLPPPREFPGPAERSGDAGSRSALKKINGRPATYYEPPKRRVVR